MSVADATAAAPGAAWKPAYNPWLIAVVAMIAGMLEVADRLEPLRAVIDAEEVRGFAHAENERLHG